MSARRGLASHRTAAHGQIGRVVAVAGSQMTATLEADELDRGAVRIGAMVKVRSGPLDVVGTIAAIEARSGGSPPSSAFVVDLLGEIATAADGQTQFSRGVSHYPVAGTPVRAASEADLTAVYRRPSATNVSIGTLYHDPRRPAFVLVNELLAKNFAVLGATGSGKIMRRHIVAFGHHLAASERAHSASWTRTTNTQRRSAISPRSSMSTTCSCRSGCSISRKRSACWSAAGPRRSRRRRRSS